MLRELAKSFPEIVAGLVGLAALTFLIFLYHLRLRRTGPYWRARRAAGQRGGALFLVSVTLFGVALGLVVFGSAALILLGRADLLVPGGGGGLRGVVLPTATPTAGLEATTTAAATITATAPEPPAATPVTTRTPRTPSPPPPATAVATRIPPTATPSPPPTLTPSHTPLPTATPSATPTPTTTLTPTPSQTPTMTLTPTAHFVEILNLTPVVSQVEPGPNARVEIVAVDETTPEASAGAAPVILPPGLRRIYVFVRYAGMANGIGWSQILYRDGLPVQGVSHLWSLGAAGENVFFFGNEDGYSPGEYEARVFLGDEEVSRLAFTIG